MTGFVASEPEARVLWVGSGFVVGIVRGRFPRGARVFLRDQVMGMRCAMDPDLARQLAAALVDAAGVIDAQ